MVREKIFFKVRDKAGCFVLSLKISTFCGKVRENSNNLRQLIKYHGRLEGTFEVTVISTMFLPYEGLVERTAVS